MKECPYLTKMEVDDMLLFHEQPLYEYHTGVWYWSRDAKNSLTWLEVQEIIEWLKEWLKEYRKRR